MAVVFLRNDWLLTNKAVVCAEGGLVMASMATGGGAGFSPKRELTHKEIANKLIEEGVYHYRAGKDYEKARLSFESARDIAKRAKLELEEARALGNLANAHSNLKENIAASDLYRMSLFLFRTIV